jgi:hypothetical protein
MKNKYYAILLVALTGVFIYACTADAQEDSNGADTAAKTADLLGSATPAGNAAAAALCNCPGTLPGYPSIPVLDPTILPIDVHVDSNENCGCQPCFDCYAWQLFIDMNWPASSTVAGEPNPAAKFGTPGDMSPLVWETYMNTDDLFEYPAGDPTPPLWGQGSSQKDLSATTAVDHLSATVQADFSWLTDVDSNLVYYEIRVNKDEYDYIYNNTLYNQTGLHDAFTATGGSGLSLPDGATAPYNQGAIEVKASWRIVPDAKLPYFQQNYKLSTATLGDNATPVNVALVGLHIIKKTPLSDQWVWSTWEHKDNAPDIADTASAATLAYEHWNFFNPAIPASTVPDWKTPTNADGNPNTPQNIPVQLVRVTPIDAQAAALNAAMHTYIDSINPGSVWGNYNLVNMQWPTKPKTVNPIVNNLTDGYLKDGTPTPDSLANITMESFLQLKSTGGGSGNGVSSCIGCHARAAVTPKWGNSAWDTTGSWWMTDYSNIFFKAQYRVGD